MLGRVYVWRGAFWRVLSVRRAGLSALVEIESLTTGERIVRPIRGMRRASQSMAFVLPVSAVAWDLRGALASRRTIRAVLSERCDGVYPNAHGKRILEGTVDGVAASDAFAIIAGRHVPIEEILSVRTEHFTWEADASDPTDPLERASADVTGTLPA